MTDLILTDKDEGFSCMLQSKAPATVVDDW